ncbi:MAG: ExeA family protein [bacterium]
MLTPQILDAIGVERDPFNSEMSSLFDLFLPKQHKLVLDKGLDAAAKCKFIAITGPVGTGKTIVKLALIERLKEKQNYMISEPEIIDMPKCLPATIIDSMLEDFMFLRSNTDNFKPIARKGSSRNKGTLEDRSRWIHSLLKIKVRDGKKLVLIIDEAHLLPVHTLKTLKRFHEMQDGFSKLLSIILIGQDELVHFLNGNYEIREVTARLNIVEMQPIPNLVKEYLNHKVQRAGGRLENLIDDSGLKAVKTLLNGERAIPISINNLVAKAVEDGYNLDALPVNAEIIENSYAKLKNL